MKILSFKNVDFDFDNGADYWCAITDENAYGAWQMVPEFTARRNAAGVITALTVSDRQIQTEVGYDGADSIETAFLRLVGQINPLDPEPGTLVVELNDGTTLTCQAIALTAGQRISDEGFNVVMVNFITVDPLWHAESLTYEGPETIATALYGGIDLDIGGAAPVPLTVRLTPTAGNQVKVRTFTITNTSEQPLPGHPYRVDFGDTSVNGFLPADALYNALLLDGVPQRAAFQGFGSAQTYVWLIIPYLAPGNSLTYTVLNSPSYALVSPVFETFYGPAFDYSATSITGTGGSTTTLVTTTGTFALDQLRGGTLKMLTGPNAGISKVISGNSAGTGTTITTTAFSFANASGNIGLVTMSSNSQWIYPVRQTERTDIQRGLWWIDKGEVKPSQARFDGPGFWSPYLYYDNNDLKNQSSWAPITVGADADYFAILDADRTWEGGHPLNDEGGADGIILTSPVPITGLSFAYGLKNPNGMATFFVGSRSSGAGEFVQEFVDVSQNDTLTVKADQTLTLAANAHQLYLGILPTTVDGIIRDEIGTTWISDSGSATGGSGNTQLNDNTQDWYSDQWIGATLKIVDGTNKGQSRTITDSSPNTITTAAFPANHDSTERYTVKQKPLIATVRTDDFFIVSLDSSAIVCSTPTAPVNGYVLDRTLYLDRDTASAAPPYQRVRFSYDVTGRYVVFIAGESLVIDGEETRAWITTGPHYVASANDVALANGANIVSLPTGTAIGDTVIAYVRNYNSATLTPPFTFSLAESKTVSGVTHAVYYGIGAGSPTETWTYSAGPASATVSMVTYRGVDPFIDSGQVETTSGTSHAITKPTPSPTDRVFAALLSVVEQNNPAFEDATLAQWSSPGTAGFTKTFVRSTSPSAVRTGLAGGLLTVTANSNGVNGQVNIDCDDMIPVATGASVTVKPWVKPSVAGIHPRAQIHWHNAAGTYLSTSIEPDYTPAANTYVQRSFTATAPANAAQMKKSVACVFTTAALTGTVAVDETGFAVSRGGVLGVSGDMDNRSVTTGAVVYDGIINDATVTVTTPATTHQLLFLLTFGIPEADLTRRALPPRSLIVQDIEADGTERLAEQWLTVTPGDHTLMLSALVGGNDYDLAAEWRENYYG